jgi:hypothetical protein
MRQEAGMGKPPWKWPEPTDCDPVPRRQSDFPFRQAGAFSEVFLFFVYIFNC